MQSVQFGVDYAKDAFEVHVKSRNELVSSYGSYLMFGFFANFCCCFKNCLDRKGGMRKNARRYLKFRLALERLAQEQDIQYIMQMNRVTHLIHSSTFLARQRRAIKYGHKYVISDKYLDRKEHDRKLKKNERPLLEIDSSREISKVLDGFDPHNNAQDRRILFEVTGMRTNLEEFREGESSDSDDPSDVNSGKIQGE